MDERVGQVFVGCRIPLFDKRLPLFQHNQPVGLQTVFLFPCQSRSLLAVCPLGRLLVILTLGRGRRDRLFERWPRIGKRGGRRRSRGRRGERQGRGKRPRERTQDLVQSSDLHSVHLSLLTHIHTVRTHLDFLPGQLQLGIPEFDREGVVSPLAVSPLFFRTYRLEERGTLVPLLEEPDCLRWSILEADWEEGSVEVARFASALLGNVLKIAMGLKA